MNKKQILKGLKERKLVPYIRPTRLVHGSGFRMFEIGYSKWFKPKPVFIIKELITQELPPEINKSLDIKYISMDELNEELN